MRLALAIASFVILIVHGFVFYDQFFHRWERHQTAYFDQARALTRNEAERAALDARSPRIEQLIVTSFGEERVDRCVTCHVAMDDPRFANHAQPLRTHPYSAGMGDIRRNGRWERRHKFSDFGCTICHAGQGRALDNHYSHGEDHYWPDPLLGYVTQANWRADLAPKLAGKEYIEAACAQCHTGENFAGTPAVHRGRRLFFSSNCYGCHKIDRIADGTLGPDLTEAGRKFKVDYLWESISDPRANLTTSFMPKFRLADADVKALVVFLKSRRGMNFSETTLDRFRAQLRRPEEEPAAAAPASGAAPEAARGKQLVADRACAACHRVGLEDGYIAPDLNFAGLIRDERWLMDHFENPRAVVSDSIMPAFRFSEDEFRAMSAYLVSLRSAPAALSATETYRNLCARCHGEKGDGNGVIAWYLDPAPRDLTKAAFMNSKPPERLLASVREGVAGTSMPAWMKILDEEQARAVLEHIAAAFTREPRRPWKARALPERNPVAASPASAGRGERIFVARCAGCHGRKADGKGPNSLDIVPRPRNLRNTAFVHSVSDRRLFESILYGVQGTAMPPWVDYGLSQTDVGDIVNFIRSVNQKPARSLHASN